jgi:hypothetical protein
MIEAGPSHGVALELVLGGEGKSVDLCGRKSVNVFAR